jgi:ribosomal protein S18 acetylase RimI-like enzyme
MNERFTFGLAADNDAGEILRLYRGIVGTPGCTWSSDYPCMENILSDIGKASLYCLRDEDGRIAAVAAAGEDDELEHDGIPWDAHMKRPCDLARIGVRPDCMRRGLGTLMLREIITDVPKRGFDGIRMLVSKTNPAALALYGKFEFQVCADIYKYGIDFYCYQLVLRDAVKAI